MPRRRNTPCGVAYPDWIRGHILDSPVCETTRSIAKRLNVSQSTVVRVLNEEDNRVRREGPRPNKCILSQDDAAFLCLLKCHYPQASLAECQLALDIERSKQVSLSTISRELKRLGMTRKKMQRFSSRRDEDSRVRWWTHPPHLGGCAGVDWTNFVDIDESNLAFGDSFRQYGHSFTGIPARYASKVSMLYSCAFD